MATQVDRRSGRGFRRLDQESAARRARRVYDGPQGALLVAASFFSGHLTSAERLFRTRKFDLGGSLRILDVGTGAGQLAKPLVRYCPPHAQVTCCDASPDMLRRARARIGSTRPRFVQADVTQLPFSDANFDTVTCGFVLEHLADATTGLMEIARVLDQDGRLFLLFMTDSLSSSWTRQLWGCRTYSRDEMLAASRRARLKWLKEFPVDPWQQMIRGKGLCVEMIKQ
jgi:ubiquinone/menaquinone biosynthesis C-methylase UbiE